MAKQATTTGYHRPNGAQAGFLPYIVLMKPVLNLLVVLTGIAGFVLASSAPMSWGRLIVTSAGIILSACSAAVLNQWLERRSDALMKRTRDRPLPAGAVPPIGAMVLGIILGIAGVGLLLVYINLLSALLALATIVIYLAVYTPLKTRSPYCTVFGAVSGAIPPLIGYAGAAGRLDYAAWTLAALMFVWQIPHFLALAWRYRDDYRAGGFRMLPELDGKGRVNSNMLLLYSVALVPLGMAPYLAGLGGRRFIIWSFILGVLLVVLAMVQHRLRSVMSARVVFMASVIYLPVLFGMLLGEHLPAVAAPREAMATGAGQAAANIVNGFDLGSLTVPAGLVVAGTGRDSIPALTDPVYILGSEVEEKNHSGGHGSGKFLVDSDRVIGVAFNGESRAYPVRIMNWHEAVNDTVGGLPVCVTFCPLCDSAVVFSREIEGEVREFGLSGLVYNSNALLYDRNTTGESSLWGQLSLKAVGGPAGEAGVELEPLPCTLTYWGEWLREHPDTTVITGDISISKRYKSNPYGHYAITGSLKFPVEPLPPAKSPPLMARVMAVRYPGGWQAYLYDSPNVELPMEELNSTDNRGSPTLWLHQPKGMVPPVVMVENPEGYPVVYCFWFAWHATHPELPVPDPGLLDAWMD